MKARVALVAAVFGLLLVAPPAAAQRYSEWSEPINLGTTVNSTAVDGCPFIGKDGFSLFFASNRSGGSGGLDLYVSEWSAQEEAWGTPIEMVALNSATNDLCPTVSIDRHRIFFVSNRSGGCGGNDIYVSFRRDKRDNLDAWESPLNLDCTINSSLDEYSPAYFEDDDGSEYLYFSACTPGTSECDLYVSARQSDGSWGAPSAVTELNSASSDMRPNIARDGLTIYFDSTRPGGSGSSDLYVATRESPGDAWSTPQNLGSGVNSAAADFRPSIAFDGTALYFSSSRSGSLSGSVDLWVTTRQKVKGKPD